MREVRLVSEYQVLVEGIYTQIGYQLQTNRQTNAAQIAHHLVESEAPRVSKRSIRPPKLVFDNISGVPKQYFSCFLLALDHVGYHSRQVIQQFGLCPSKRRLVGDLEEVSDDLAPFPIESAVSQAYLLKTGKYFCDLFRQNQAGEVNENRRTKAGSGVRRARRQESELVMK